ncbi:MAG TPA: HNH endonuclease signature motif containing protein [Rhizomicrobium sp.]|nr:HNH endonuclease signature motif containing protein [Rhizomicrobium sp.]
MTKRLPNDMPCKPCWELKYCPYGWLVELSPFPAEDGIPDHIASMFEQTASEFAQGKIEKDDVFGEAARLMHLAPGTWEEIEGYRERDIGCKIFGHVCPVFWASSGATETVEDRKQGRSIPRSVMFKVVRRDDHVCQKCHKYVPDDEVEFDHVIPYSKGGPTTVDNLRLLCRSCNRKKSDSMEGFIREW